MSNTAEHSPIVIYEWTITRSHIGIEREGEKVVGPHAAIRTSEKIEADPHGEAFQMYDDDGTLYFEGIFCGNADTTGFEPLDDFGFSFGCTEIRYLSAKSLEWETL